MTYIPHMPPADLAALRRDYSLSSLKEADVDPDPIRQFERWFAEALAAQVLEPNAMTLSTASRDGVPSGRIVLLKGVDARGFAFYTDYRSRKSAELAENPLAALTFLWKEIERQVRITGAVSRVSAEESESYFRSRPVGSRIGAWASHQSSVIPNRADLEERVRTVSERFSNTDVPLPSHWGGFRVLPDEIEFWQGRPDRLHDRIRYRREETAWIIERLSP
jgi:pyridoxamine 5'-phosphate oxidase